MRLFLVFAVVLAAFGQQLMPVVSLDSLPQVGSKIRPTPEMRKSRWHYTTAASQLDPTVFAVIGGVKYLLSYRPQDKKSRTAVVTQLGTSDPGFVSPSGHRVGDVVEVDLDDFRSVPGFLVYAGDPVGGWTWVVGVLDQITVESQGERRADHVADLREAGVSPIRVEIRSFVAR